MAQLRRILVTTDLSEPSLAALRWLRDFPPAREAEVLITHVLAWPFYPFGVDTASVKTLEREVREGTAARLNELVDAEVRAGVKARGVLRAGDPVAQVLAVAHDEHADLIVVASHGYSGVKHALLGSVAERIVRKATCPVLVVRSAS